MNAKLIHVARFQGNKFLFLRQLDLYRYCWFLEDQAGLETPVSIWGGSVEEAILAARKEWAVDLFRTLNCGFRYTLPERDEVGTNALFYQMAASYASMTGIYFDEEVGCNCIVQNASMEARDLWNRLKNVNCT